MATYPKRVADRILPLSISPSVREAIREWSFTGSTHDYEEALETCELCGQEGLRYHFRIANRLNQNTLEVGSECILRFEVPIYRGDRELTPAEAKRVLNDEMNRMRLESCLKSLERLAETEANPILLNALVYYRREKRLTPKFAFVVFWKLQDLKIDHDPSSFKIRLDRGSYVEDLRTMQSSRVHRFWRALSSQQRQKAIELGHSPPGQ